MARLADDWSGPGDDGARQMCVDVLCAYLRLPYGAEFEKTKPGEREVRRTLIRVIRDHLREDKTPDERLRWSGLSFSFEGSTPDSIFCLTSA